MLTCPTILYVPATLLQFPTILLVPGTLLQFLTIFKFWKLFTIPYIYIYISPWNPASIPYSL